MLSVEKREFRQDFANDKKMPKKIHFETLGCKLNQVESEGAASAFKNSGFSVSMTPFSASKLQDDDIILCIVNTCTVTAKAEQKARRIIRLLLFKCPNSAVLVTGCYAQNSAEEIRSIGERVCVLGGQYKGHLADIPDFLNKNPFLFGKALANAIDEKSKRISALSSIAEIQQPFRLVPDGFIHHSRASLKIQDGCNCVCTYCAIRLARGKSVSLEVEQVLSRIKALEESGQNEVVITTVNISQYRGFWNGDYVNFSALLKLILENTKKIRIRISSLYPETVDEEFAKIVENPRVCPHFHISVQSGSDSILLKMKRPYKIEAVYKACSLLKKAKSNPFFACDIIAGFPGESEEDFALTMKMLKDCGFTFVHAFPFSARPNTLAYKMRPMVPNSVAGKRVSLLEDYNSISKNDYINSFIGATLIAICENVHKPKVLKDRVIVHAVTDNFLHCQLIFTKEEKFPQSGSLIYVKIRRPLTKDEVTGECDTLADFQGFV